MDIKLQNGLSFDLSILLLQELHPHEEIIPRLVDAIVQDMKESGIQRDPILVDKNSGVVLDGMHRRVALEKIGAHFAVCSRFDYAADVELGRWLRTFSSNDPEVLTKLTDLFLLRETSAADAVKDVDSHLSPLAVMSDDKSYVSELNYDLESVYSKLAEFDEFASKKGIDVTFEDENRIESHAGGFVIYPMVIEKVDVEHFAQTGKKFPHKTTRHTVLIRPVNVCFPLDLLQQNDIGKCEKELATILSSANPLVLEPDTPFNGRRYSEPIAVVVTQE